MIYSINTHMDFIVSIFRLFGLDFIGDVVASVSTGKIIKV